MTARARVLDISISVIVAAACIFLILPTVIIIPISFTSSDFIIFPPVGYSTRWYIEFFNSYNWQHAAKNSFIIAIMATVLATAIGTVSALAIARLSRRWARTTMTLFLLPMIVPSIISAVAMYAAFARFEIVGTRLGMIIGHAILGLPFVVINVSASLQKMDWRIEHAARSLGASPARAFFEITLPIIRPGVMAGAVFAFLTSFDEVVVSLFLAGIDAATLPVQMWSGIRFEMSPMVAAVSCLLLLLSVCMLTAFLIFQRGETK
jgi:putative spermidine/putrescine transport system permease protein